MHGSYVNRCPGPSYREILQQTSKSMSAGAYRDEARQSATALRARSMAYSPSPAIRRARMPVVRSSGKATGWSQPRRTSAVETARGGR